MIIITKRVCRRRRHPWYFDPGGIRIRAPERLSQWLKDHSRKGMSDNEIPKFARTSRTIISSDTFASTSRLVCLFFVYLFSLLRWGSLGSPLRIFIYAQSGCFGGLWNLIYCKFWLTLLWISLSLFLRYGICFRFYMLYIWYVNKEVVRGTKKWMW